MAQSKSRVTMNDNFDPDKDARKIEAVVRKKTFPCSSGVDEQTIYDILSIRSCNQQQEIAYAFKRRFEKNMISALKKALSGSKKTAILDLLKNIN